MKTGQIHHLIYPLRSPHLQWRAGGRISSRYRQRLGGKSRSTFPDGVETDKRLLGSTMDRAASILPSFLFGRFVSADLGPAPRSILHSFTSPPTADMARFGVSFVSKTHHRSNSWRICDYHFTALHTTPFASVPFRSIPPSQRCYIYLLLFVRSYFASERIIIVVVFIISNTYVHPLRIDFDTLYWHPCYLSVVVVVETALYE